MNNVKKGKKFENIVYNWLQNKFNGIILHKAIRVKFQTNDIFNAFDIVGFFDGEFIWIQVTTKNGMSSRKKKILSLPYWRNQYLFVYDDKDNSISCYIRDISNEFKLVCNIHDEKLLKK